MERWWKKSTAEANVFSVKLCHEAIKVSLTLTLSGKRGERKKFVSRLLSVLLELNRFTVRIQAKK